MKKYTVTIWWSEENTAFLAKALELGCMTHGDTAEEALKEMENLIPFWLEAAREKGTPNPEPQPELVVA